MPRLLTLRPSHQAIPRWVATTLAAGSLVAGTLAANASAAETITSEFPDDVLVHTGPGGDALSVLNPMGPLTEASDADPVDIVRGYLRTFRSEFGLTGGGLNSLTLDSVITDPDGVTHVGFRQVVDGIDVFRAVITGAVDSSGRLVHIGGDVADVAPETDSDADVTAADAIAAAAQSVADTDVDAGDLPDEADTTRPEEVSVDNVLAEGVIDPTPLSAKKRWYMVDDGRALRLAWVTDVELSGHQWFESVVDAETGTVLEESSRYAHAAPEGRVYDVQHPDVAGATRALRPFSGIGGTWVSGTTTSGNNVNAYRDLDDSDANDEYQPSDAGQVFDYAFTDAWRVNADGSNASLDADIDAVITQLFYYTNLVHDYT